jgi:hypothetical protein
MKIKLTDYTEFTPPIGRYWSQIRTRKMAGYVDGVVITSQGIVSVYAQVNLTSLGLVHEGVYHKRVWERWWGNNTIVRLAREFAKDIVGG